MAAPGGSPAMTHTDPIAPPARLCIFGATGATGSAALTQALGRGFEVRGVVHDPSETLPGGAERVVADVLNDDLAPVVAGCDAVLSCLGVANDPQTLLNPPPLYTDGTGAIIRAMEAEGVARLVVISASFLSAPNRGPILFRLGAEPALARVFSQMADMEELLEQSALAWTAMRPGWLMEGELTEDYMVRPEAIPSDTIRTRHADLAHMMLNCVERGEWLRGKPALARRESEENESNAKVINAMLA